MNARWPSLAATTGLLAGVLQMAGALKTATLLGALPFDLTLASLALLLPMLALLATTRRWRLAPALALPMAAAALLWFWMVIAGTWSASHLVVDQKLLDITLAGPLMLLAGMLVGADPAALRGLHRAMLGIGLLLASSIAWGASFGLAALVQDLDQARLQYQLAGLALASAAALAALAVVEARSMVGRLGWLLAILFMAGIALLPGGRTALLALAAGVVLAPALRLGGAAGLGWALAVLTALAGLGLWLLLHPDLADGLRTLERLTSEPAGLDARRSLWAAALHWAGEAAPFGLGTGGFSIAAGHGEWRGRYPHNHVLEVLAEAGLPGLLLWLGSFGGAVMVMGCRAAAVGRQRLARIAAMVLPVGFTILVSTDLGNRMAWFALGLALSLGLEALPRARFAGAPRHV